MNNVLDDSLVVSSAQTAARKGLGLETTTNQRSVSSVLTRTSGINPQQIADAGQKVRFPTMPAKQCACAICEPCC